MSAAIIPDPKITISGTRIIILVPNIVISDPEMIDGCIDQKRIETWIT